MRTASFCSKTAVVALLVLAATSHASSYTFEYISPRPDARFVSKGTRLAFRLSPVPPSFPEIRVVGSSSGALSGSWIRADDGITLIFRPEHEFAPGEKVDVSVSCRGVTELYRFTVSSRVGPPRSVQECECFDADAPPKRTDVLPLRTADGVPAPSGFPGFQVTVNGPTDQGHVFVAPGEWIAIMANDGTFCYFERRPSRVTDFKISPSGNLTFMERNPEEPVPQVRAKGLVMDNTYTVVDEFVAGNGYAVETDFHEFTQLANGNVILMIYDEEPVDMSQIVAGGDPNAIVQGLVLQEIDPSHNVVFEWRSWDHFQITDTYQSLTASFIDYVHGNAIEVDTDGHWLVSSRNMSEVTKIDRNTGDVIWRLGGKNNEFTFFGTLFTRQHDIRRIPNGNITVYDNGNDSTPQESRAVEYSLGEGQVKAAAVVWEFYHPGGVFSPFTGSARRLSNGNTFISWGNQRRQTEVDPAGTIVWEATGLGTYRSSRQVWTGAVAARPTLWIEPEEGSLSATLNFTRFGDPNVAEYCIYSGFSPNPTTLLATTTETSYLVTDLEAGVNYYYRVTAKDGQGTESPYSNEELVLLNPVVPVLIQQFSAVRSRGGVDLAWDVFADEPVLGFRLYRAAGGEAQVPINRSGLIAGDRRSYHDVDAAADRSYAYVLAAVLGSGSEIRSQTVTVDVLAPRFLLDQNHPNPFNPSTSIRFEVPAASFVDLGVFDTSGRRVRTLVQGVVEAGPTRVVWDGRDEAGRPVASGVYFCRLFNDSRTLTRKMLLLK